MICALPLLAACSTGPGRFPLAEPQWVDHDQRPSSERPEENYSPFAWDAADQTIFRPISRFFAVDPAGEAANLNALDEVPDSSWFQNRIGLFPMSAGRLARGPCVDPPLDPTRPWTITQGKTGGANPGFIIEGPEDRRYLVKLGGVEQGPRASAADVVGSRVYYAAGYYVPCNRIVYFDRSILRIASDATYEDEKGNDHHFNEKHLDGVLRQGLQLRDGRYRAMSSQFLEGMPLGPWRYQGTRDDDPNDVIAHEDRRELRGMRLLAAWIQHFDSRESNTLSMWLEDEPGMGHVRHNLIDFGDSLGSLWSPPMLGKRIGHAYYLDVPYLVEDWITLGVIERPWDHARFGPSGTVFAYFRVRDFDPEKWRPGYPNPAFSRMRERDGAWMARIIARFSDEHVAALVRTADLRDELLDRELYRILVGRRNRILRRYLGRLSPLTRPRLERTGHGARLCLQDLVLTRFLERPRHRHYRGRAWIGKHLRSVDLGRAAPMRRDLVCVALPANPGGSAKRPRYVIVDVAASTATAAQPPTRVHFYHLGGDDFRIAGVERPDDDAPPR